MFFRLVKLVSAAMIAIAVHSPVPAGEQTTRTLSIQDARDKYAAPASQFADIDGINVHYRDEGQGPVVLLMHGTLGDLSDWDEWADELKQNFRVVRLDLPGFGLTADMPNDNYSVPRMHVLIDGLMDHLGAEKFAVVGISYGGMVMFRYAATRTERVTAMVLINSAGIQRGKRAKSLDKPNSIKPAKPKKNMFIDPIVLKEDVEAFYEGYINDPAARTPSFIQRKLDLLNIEGRDDISVKAYKLYEQGNPLRVLSHVRAPTLIMWGAGNQALDTETATTFMNALPMACSKELVTFTGGGHYINIERPKETVLMAEQFLHKLQDNPPKGCAGLSQ